VLETLREFVKQSYFFRIVLKLQASSFTKVFKRSGVANFHIISSFFTRQHAQRTLTRFYVVTCP
jgi:hypothetical protein